MADIDLKHEKLFIGELINKLIFLVNSIKNENIYDKIYIFYKIENKKIFYKKKIFDYFLKKKKFYFKLRYKLSNYIILKIKNNIKNIHIQKIFLDKKMKINNGYLFIIKI